MTGSASAASVRPVAAPCEPAKTATTLPLYLTPRQVADALQVDERTVLRWAQQDATMPVTRFGRVIRFERAALLRWLERKKGRLARSSAQAAAQGAVSAA